MDEQILAIADFAENYSFVLQDEIQGYHCTNSQATIRSFVVYHHFPVEGNESTDLKGISFVAVSDHLLHDATGGHYFQSKVIEFLREIMSFKKVISISQMEELYLIKIIGKTSLILQIMKLILRCL